jgi:enamine deaminase RidA (YjgF/YER057c/UK114 family)
LTSPPDPVGIYEPFRRCGNLIFLSAISSARDGEMIVGKLGRDLSHDDAREAARRAAENLLAVLSIAAGSEDNIAGILLLRGHVNAAENVADVHKIIDAASEVIVARLGAVGRHARTAIGCSTLPNNNSVTLEAIACLRA